MWKCLEVFPKLDGVTPQEAKRLADRISEDDEFWKELEHELYLGADITQLGTVLLHSLQRIQDADMDYAREQERRREERDAIYAEIEDAS